MTWLPTACLLSMAYKSNLLASLVKVSEENPVDTFDDILERDMTVFLGRGSLAAHLLATSPKPVVRRAYIDSYLAKGGAYDFAGSREDPVPRRVSDAVAEGMGVQDAIESNFAAGRTRRGAGLTVGNFQCAYYYREDLPILAGLDRLVTALVESGIYSRRYRHHLWLSTKKERDYMRKHGGDEDDRNAALDFSHVVSAFLVMALTLAAAAAAFIIETCGK